MLELALNSSWCDTPTICRRRIDDTNDSYGLGGGGRVVYEPTPRQQIAAVRWARVGDFEVLSEQKCERGVLITTRTGKRREHCYSYYDVRDPDASTALLQARGLQGGGESWASVVRGLVALKKPAIALDIELDPEGDGLAVRSRKRSAPGGWRSWWPPRRATKPCCCWRSSMLAAAD